MKSISTKLALTFIAIFLLVISAISSVLIFISTTSTKDLTLSGAQYRVELQAKSLDQAFSNRSSVLKSIAEIIVNMDAADSDTVQDILAPIYAANEDYNLYVGFGDNRAIFADAWEPDSSWVATERDWYVEGAKNPGTVASTVPYVDEMTGEICFTMVYGMMKDGKLLGVMALDVYTDSLLSVMQDDKYAIDGQHSLLTDKAGNIYYHPDEAYAPSAADGFQNLNDIDSSRFAPIFNAQGNRGDIILTGLTGKKSYFLPVGIEGSDWIVCGVISVAELEKQMAEQIVLTIVVGGISLLLAILIIIYIVRKMITAPITQMVEAARTMATGDLDITTKTDANDELGDFGRAFQAIINDTQASVKTIQAVAGGDLTQSINIRSEKDVMGSALSDMLERNNDVMSEILRASGMVSNCSRQIADISQTLAGGASAQSEAVERLSASISQISDITQQNMKQSLDTSSLGDEIIKDAERGGAQMTDMLKAVKEIDEASRSIGHVIKTIDDIAFQTNILALNAAVEAARAGQHGKGFAVVAEEVRNLATKSAEAAKNTSELISDSIEKADFGSQLASQTAVSFEHIVNKLSLSVEKIKEISHYSEKQVQAIQSIDNELQSVLQVAQQNSASAEEASAAATEMNGQSNMLEKSVSQFNLKGNRATGFSQSR